MNRGYNKTFILLFLIFALSEKSFSFPNYKVYLNEDGVYKLNLKKIPFRNINIQNKGKDIPYFLSKNGEILFYGERNKEKYSKENIYWVKEGEGEIVNLEEILPKDEGILFTERFEENKIYDPLERYYWTKDTYKKEGLDHWFWKKISPKKTNSLSFCVKNFKEDKAKIKIYFQEFESNTECEMEIYLNKKLLSKISFKKNEEKIISLDIILNYGKNILGIKSNKKIYLNFFEITYKKKKERIVYKKPEKIIEDIPSSLHATDNRADYIIITLKKFTEDILRLAKYREGKGLKVKIIDVEDIYDEFNFGIFSPIAIRDFLRYAYNNWQKPSFRFVLLVGDATTDVDWFKKDVLPTYILHTISGGDTGSDNFYAQMDDDDLPDVAIGRLPVDNCEELKTIIDKIISYENNNDFGEWRKRIFLVSSDDPNMSKEILSLMESSFIKIFDLYVPYCFDVNALLGLENSYFTYIPEKFPDKIVEKFNEGCLVLNFIGHGYLKGWGDIHRQNKKYTTFNDTNLSKINCRGKYPFLIEVCCKTGYFDYPFYDCVSEKLLKLREGPVGVFAASRVSDPYSNTILEKEFLFCFFKKNFPTIGEALLDTKKRIFLSTDLWRKKIDSFAKVGFQSLFPDFVKENTEEIMILSRKAEIYLYNLLGDPALVLNYPKDEINIKMEKEVKRGEKINIEGEVKNVIEGEVILTIEVERDKFIYPLFPVNYKDKNYKENLIKNFNNANNKIIKKEVIKIVNGKFNSVLEIPKELSLGFYYLKCYAYNKTSSSSSFFHFKVVE